MTRNETAYGMLPSRREAELCLQSLLAARFNQTDISLLTHHHITGTDLSRYEYRRRQGETAAVPGLMAPANDVMENMLQTDLFILPGLGLLLAAGPVATTLDHLDAPIAAQGITGILKETGIPSGDAAYYEAHIRDGGIMVAVHCHNEEESGRARSLLLDHHAEPVATSATATAIAH